VLAATTSVEGLARAAALLEVAPPAAQEPQKTDNINNADGIVACPRPRHNKQPRMYKPRC
jgi:hypothetical protein